MVILPKIETENGIAHALECSDSPDVDIDGLPMGRGRECTGKPPQFIVRVIAVGIAVVQQRNAPTRPRCGGVGIFKSDTAQVPRIAGFGYQTELRK